MLGFKNTKMMEMAVKGMIKKAGYDPKEIEELLKSELQRSPDLAKNPQKLMEVILSKATKKK